jgi:WD40 repeat protein
MRRRASARPVRHISLGAVVAIALSLPSLAGARPRLRLAHTIGGELPPVAALTYSPDGRTVLTAGGGVVRLWDAASGSSRRTLLEMPAMPDACDGEPAASGPVAAEIRGASFSPDGRVAGVVVLEADGAGDHPWATMLYLWKVRRGTLLRRTPLPAGTDAYDIEAGGARVWLSGLDETATRRWLRSYDVRRSKLSPITVRPVTAVPDPMALPASRESDAWPALRASALSLADAARRAWTPVSFDLASRVIFSRDGGSLVLASRNGAEVWDARGHSLTVRIDGCGRTFEAGGTPPVVSQLPPDQRPACEGPTGWIREVALGPTGRSLAILQSRGLFIWDLAARRTALAFDECGEVRTLPQDRDRWPGDDAAASPPTASDPWCGAWQLGAIAIEPVDRHVTAGGSWGHGSHETGVGRVHVWAMDKQRSDVTIAGEGRDAWSLSFSPDSKLLATGAGSPATARVWDVETGRLVRAVDPSGNPVAAALSADGSRLFTVAADQQEADMPGAAEVWPMTSGIRLEPADVPRGRLPLGIVFAPAGPSSVLLGTSRDYDKPAPLELLDLASRQIVRSLSPAWDQQSTIAITTDGKRAAAGTIDRAIVVWDLATGAVVHRLAIGDQAVTAVAFGASDSLLLATLSDRREPTRLAPPARLRSWSLDTGAPGLDLVLSKRKLAHSIAVAPDGRLVALGFDDGTIRLCVGMTATRCHTVDAHRGPVQRLAFSPDGRWLASGSSDWRVRLWRVSGHDG